MKLLTKLATIKYNNKAFSLAEMMVVMLILSLVLAASVPIMTKQRQTIITGSVPTGTVVSFIGTTPPNGWLLCNGQSTSGHAALAALVGANVPNLNDRFIVGAGTTYSLGDTGGVDEVTLTGPQTGIAAHTHTTSDYTHYHNLFGSTASDYDSNLTGIYGNEGFIGIVANGGGIWGPDSDGSHRQYISDNTHSHTVYENTEQNASESHENRPPYYALTYIIKD